MTRREPEAEVRPHHDSKLTTRGACHHGQASGQRNETSDGDQTIQHEFDCSESTFWEVAFFDEEFSRRLYLEELEGFRRGRCSSKRCQRPRCAAVWRSNLWSRTSPAPVKKLKENGFGYVEEGELDRVKGRYTFKVIPGGSMADKTRTSRAKSDCEPLGDKRVRRVVDFKVDIKIFMVGKRIEQKSIDDTSASYDKMAAFNAAAICAKRALGARRAAAS